jgi:F-type H+-transporting ATPase subunit gamma
MAKARALVKRRASIRNLRKITHTMNLIATTRYQKNLKRISSFRPFAVNVRRMLAELLVAYPQVEHPLLRPHERGNNRVALVVLTSNRGLCGAFNVNVLRAATDFIETEEGEGKEVEVYVLGHKGAVYFAQRERALAGRYEAPGSAGVPEYGQVVEFAGRMRERYGRGDIDGVYIAMTRFISPGRQPNEVIQIMPVPVKRLLEQARVDTGRRRAMDVSPAPQTLLEELLPAAVNVTMYQAVLEAAASEQFTRMISMKNATENADRLIKSLTMQYNRARQSQITTELCEIMGAVEAMR